MTKRLLILGAGSGASDNLIRSLRADAELVLIGAHSDRFVLATSSADRRYLVAARERPEFAATLRRVVEREAIDLVIPNSDADVRAIAAIRDDVGTRVFLPRPEVIERCQDKLALTMLLRERDIPAPLTCPVAEIDGIEGLFDALAPRRRLWCRMRSGAGSMGAIPVTTPEQARSWIAYWRDMRGIAPSVFTLSEFLPGRDFNVQGVWKDGAPIVMKMIERLSYYGGAHNPSGMSSTPALAKTVCEPPVFEICAAAIRALDPAAAGVFNVDVKERADGTPCITEINAGRFAMITNVHDFTGKHNTALVFVRAALDEPLDVADVRDVADDYYLVRDLDTEPAILHANDLFDRVQDA